LEFVAKGTTHNLDRHKKYFDVKGPLYNSKGFP
jgi:hypothetical protein